jgi:hypothetical protein
VLARSAPGHAVPAAASSSPLASGFSMIASTITSQPARSATAVVTRMDRGFPPSTLPAADWASSSARHAEASLRAKSQTSPRADAVAARPQATAPLPAMPGRRYPVEALMPALLSRGMADPELSGSRHRVAAAGVAGVMLVLAFSLWTVIPLAWIWIGSRVSTTQAPSAGPYMLTFFGIVASIVIIAVALSWLNGVFARLMGGNEVSNLYPRAEWMRSLSDERQHVRAWTVMEVVIVLSLVGAVLAMMIWFFFIAGSSLPNQ